MSAVVKCGCIVVLLLGGAAPASEPKPIEWKGAVDAIDMKAKTFAMLVVAKVCRRTAKS